MLGDVMIKTMANLFGMKALLLIHPWISPLLDQDFACSVTRFDLSKRALRLVARFRQPFTALLLAPLARVQYRRVATDSLIIVRVRKETLDQARHGELPAWGRGRTEARIDADKLRRMNYNLRGLQPLRQDSGLLPPPTRTRPANPAHALTELMDGIRTVDIQ
jgi:hypothetical protein